LGAYCTDTGFINANIPLALGSDGGVKEQNQFLNLMLAKSPIRPTAFGLEAAMSASPVNGSFTPQDGVIGRPSLWIAEDLGCCASG